jgi:hypothetical protein
MYPENAMKRLIPLLMLAIFSVGYGAATPGTAASAPPAAIVSPVSGLTVFIGGLRKIDSQNWCVWEASVSGGTAPYSYSWSTVNGGGTGYDEVWGGHFPTSGSLTVVVTDALGAMGTSTINVTSVYAGPVCP